MSDEEPIYTTRAECRRVALAALEHWIPSLRVSVEAAVDQISKEEIQGGLWGPDALVELISHAVEIHLKSDSLTNPAMAIVVETDRLAAGGVRQEED